MPRYLCLDNLKADMEASPDHEILAVHPSMQFLARDLLQYESLHEKLAIKLDPTLVTNGGWRLEK